MACFVTSCRPHGCDVVCPHVRACLHESCFLFLQTSRWAHPIPFRCFNNHQLYQPNWQNQTKNTASPWIRLVACICGHASRCLRWRFAGEQISGEIAGLLALINLYGWMVPTYLYMLWWSSGFVWICTFHHISKSDGIKKKHGPVQPQYFQNGPTMDDGRVERSRSMHHRCRTVGTISSTCGWCRTKTVRRYCWAGCWTVLDGGGWCWYHLLSQLGHPHCHG